MSETWLPVVGYEGFYSVSDLGRVRSEPRVVQGRRGVVPGKILAPAIPRITKGHGRNYLSVGLSRDGKPMKTRVHKLVADAFLGPRPPGQEVLHQDDDPLNAALSNLRYGTHVENGLDLRANNTHCRNGHLRTPASTYLRRDGGRMCGICMKIQNDSRYRSKTA